MAKNKLEATLGSEPPWLMGILNVTPDSFSDGGMFTTTEAALAHGRKLFHTGASIVDIGGESSGPGARAVSADEEIQRIAPVVTEFTKQHFISVDTYHAKTAQFCLEHGARMINDVSALRGDGDMANIIREHNAFVVLMYSKETAAHPHATESTYHYQDIIRVISEFLLRQIDYAIAKGIPYENIIVDPGMGKFLSHDPKYSWLVLEQLGQLRNYGVTSPILVSTSRKSFLGGKIADRDVASQLTGLIAALNGADILRTHNVEMAQDFLEIWRKSHSSTQDDILTG